MPKLAAALLAAAALAVTGCASTSATTTTATRAVATQPRVAHRAASVPNPMRHCDPNITANQHTSCGFAENAFKAFVAALHANPEQSTYAIVASSPVTGRSYSLTCRPSMPDGDPVRCKGATDAQVDFPIKAAVQYEEAQEGATAPPTREEAGGEEDEVGSSSHATDEQFCEEHECIGEFESEEGSVVECSDGTYSHAGGISGACSDHGGEA